MNVSLADLSPRELQVLELRKAGYSYKDIAKELGITASTAKHHMVITAVRAGLKGKGHKTVTLINEFYPAQINPEKLKVLDPVERVIARAIFGGMSNREIASALGNLSCSTIRNKARDIFNKTGAGSRVELREMLSL
jgi:DNA-binding NarL/FixJ family response regulator